MQQIIKNILIIVIIFFHVSVFGDANEKKIFDIESLIKYEKQILKISQRNSCYSICPLLNFLEQHQYSCIRIKKKNKSFHLMLQLSPKNKYTSKNIYKNIPQSIAITEHLKRFHWLLTNSQSKIINTYKTESSKKLYTEIEKNKNIQYLTFHSSCEAGLSYFLTHYCNLSKVALKFNSKLFIDCDESLYDALIQ